MLTVRNLSKQYAPGIGLLQGDFDAQPGEILALIGPNGSGKSTLLQILCDVHRPDQGECLLEGEPVHKRKHDIGYLPEIPYLIDGLTGYQFLRFLAGMKEAADFKPVEETLALLQAEASAGQKLGSLSQGHRKRIALAAALIGDPALLILDEPTNGFDTMTLLQLKSVLRKRSEEKKITVLSSHVLDFVKSIATKVIFIKNGHTLPPDPLMGDIEARYLSLFAPSKSRPPAEPVA